MHVVHFMIRHVVTDYAVLLTGFFSALRWAWLIMSNVVCKTNYYEYILILKVVLEF